MEVLQKAMVTLLSSPQLRDVLLYTTLLLIFATAWVCDRWPDLAIPAVIMTCFLVTGEASLIYLARKAFKGPSTE
jgi:hypothetical protein